MTVDQVIEDTTLFLFRLEAREIDFNDLYALETLWDKWLSLKSHWRNKVRDVAAKIIENFYRLINLKEDQYVFVHFRVWHLCKDKDRFKIDNSLCGLDHRIYRRRDATTVLRRLRYRDQDVHVSPELVVKLADKHPGWVIGGRFRLYGLTLVEDFGLEGQTLKVGNEIIDVSKDERIK